MIKSSAPHSLLPDVQCFIFSRINPVPFLFLLNAGDPFLCLWLTTSNLRNILPRFWEKLGTQDKAKQNKMPVWSTDPQILLVSMPVTQASIQTQMGSTGRHSWLKMSSLYRPLLHWIGVSVKARIRNQSLLTSWRYCRIYCWSSNCPAKILTLSGWSYLC